MKKLMIAAAIVCAAAFAQAAAVDWSMDNAYVPGSEDSIESGYFAYFFADSATLGGEGFYARTDALAAIANDDLSFLSNALIGDSGVAANEIYYGYVADYGAGSFNPGSATADNMVSGYLVILDGDPESATKAYVSEIATAGINAMEACDGISFGDLTGTQDAGAWTAVNVPEPTTGLLMLLGMAGLALRRRRA